MVVQKITEIDPKKIKDAKKVMAVLELLGITDEDLLLIKEIPTMRQELAELREFRDKMSRTIDTKASNSQKPVSKVITDVYGTPSKEFKPHYGE